MASRRGKGDGSLRQRHDHESCPPLIDGARPDHHCRGRWVATVDLGHSGGKRVRRSFYGRTRAEAQRKLRAALKDRDNNTLVSGKVPTVEDWLTYWLDVICVERELKVNTMKSHRSKVRQYLIPHIGRHRLDRLEPEHLRAMYADMRTRGLSKATIHQTHMILHRALKIAMREGKVSRNVTELLDVPSPKDQKRDRLTMADFNKILACDNARAHLALYGLRQGEALALRWSDVDLDAGIVYIERTLVRQPGVGLVFDTPKTADSQRMVPVDGRTLALLKLAHHDAPSEDALVFPNGQGGPLDHRRDWQNWTDLLAELGIPHIPLHAARNSTASLLEELGYPPRLVAEILGQSQVTTTYRYQKGHLEQHRDALKALHGGQQ